MLRQTRRLLVLIILLGLVSLRSISSQAQDPPSQPAASQATQEASQPAPAPVATPAPLVDHVIQISVDGLSGILLGEYLATAPETFPTFARLTKEGVFTLNARTDFTHTITLPNHTAMMTGRPVRAPEGQPDSVAHLWTENTDPSLGENLHSNHPSVEYIHSTFDVAHDSGLYTRLFTNKTKFILYPTSYSETTGAIDGSRGRRGGRGAQANRGGQGAATLSTRPDANSTDNGRGKIDESVNHERLGGLVHQFVASLNSTLESDRTYTFLHIADPDTAGHASGWGGPQWRQAVINVDGYLKQILDEIASNPVLAGKTALVITADHGGFDRGHGQAADRRVYTIPVIVWGVPGFQAGQDIYQVFAGITDPGEGRPDFNAPNQPIRNGSTGNLSLMLLGLDSVPGSSIFVNPKLAAPLAQRE